MYHSVGMHRPPLPAELGPSFSVADALAAGATPSRLRALDLARPFHGVRQRKVIEAHDASPEAALLRLIAQYACRMTEHEFFSHAAAAVLWGLPLPIASLRAGSLDVSVFAPRRAPAAAGVSGHSVTPGLAHVVTHSARGVRVSTPASTVALLAGRVPHAYDLVALADAAVREPLHRRDPPALTSLESLTSALDAGRRVGRDRLRAALPRVSTRTRSRAETWLRLTVIDAGLPQPEVNYDVIEGGRWLGQVDLAYPELRVAIEYEGEHHLTDPLQWAEDIARMDRLVEAGWRVIRVTKSDVFGDPSALIERIARALAGRR